MACCGKKTASRSRVVRASPWTSAKKPAKTAKTGDRTRHPKPKQPRTPVHKEQGSK